MNVLGGEVPSRAVAAEAESSLAVAQGDGPVEVVGELEVAVAVQAESERVPRPGRVDDQLPGPCVGEGAGVVLDQALRQDRGLGREGVGRAGLVGRPAVRS